MLPPPAPGKRKRVTEPFRIVSPASKPAVGLITPAVVGKFVDHDHPATVTSSALLGSIARASPRSSLDPPRNVAYFKSAVPAPSRWNRARYESYEPFHV